MTDIVQLGPQPMTQAARRDTVKAIAVTLQQHFGDKLLALGVYGSTARGTDQPFSDIEMRCIVPGEDFDQSFEWSTGPWKAEVNVLSEADARYEAAEFEGTWPLTHGGWTVVDALYDPQGLFDHLRNAALDHSETEFRHVIKMLAVGEIYELVAKLRNLNAIDGGPAQALFAAELAKYGACFIGLLNRYLYTTAAQLFSESVTLPIQIGGYADLCRLASSGKLNDITLIVKVADDFWAGIEAWADDKNVILFEGLETLLSNQAKV